MRRRLLVFLFAFGSFFMFGHAYAAPVSASVPVFNGTIEVNIIENENGLWLFLPSFADLSTIKIVDLEKPYSYEPSEEEGIWLLDADGEEIQIMKSENLRSMFFFSDDPVLKGREYIDNDRSHQTEASGSLTLIAQNGQIEYTGRVSRIRGRGNSTWRFEKKPYSIKLEDKFDLLKTGDPAEKNRNWILLADAVDASLLHNRISLDFAREMGLEDASHCESIDFFYDGEYRGTYLLTEKVEIGEGRTDELNYETLLKRWNRWIGQNDLSQLPRASGQNNLGDPICYVDGVADNGIYHAGAYLLEMYQRGQANTISGFTLNGDRAFEIVNPEYASRNMVCYVSELLSNGLSALQNGGFHPENGLPVEKWFDLESFARVILLQELTRNWDAFTLTSTYFLLPAGETRFVAGPVWDFDRTMRHPEYRNNAGYTWGIKDAGWPCWASEFYSLPQFMDIAREIYHSDIAPLVRNILLGEKNGRYLMPLDDYIAEIRMSALMNDRLWPVQDTDYDLHYADSFDYDVIYLRQFLEQRNDWMEQTFVCNGVADADHVNITLKAEWLYVEEPLELQISPWSKVDIQSISHHQLTEATEEEYALWQVSLTLVPQKGYAFHEPRVQINNDWFSGDIQPDGSLLIEFQFEDLSYRPVDFYGEDIGLIFNPDFYAFNYPQLAETCEWDTEALMDHFYYDGIYEGYIGNGFFDPKQILLFNPHLKDILGEDWSLYYWDFLSYGHAVEEWMDPVNIKFVPPVSPLAK